MSGSPGGKRKPGTNAEMEVASRLHGRPLQRLNKLARWHVRASLIGSMLATVLLLVLVYRFGRGNPVAGSVELTLGYLLLLLIMVSLLLFVAGMGAKFLPSSFGGRTHLHSLRVLLWTFWLLVLAPGVAFVSLVFLLLLPPGFQGTVLLFQGLAGGLLLVGTGLMSWNFWKTMEPLS